MTEPCTTICERPEDTLALGSCLSSRLSGGAIVALSGSLGAGKSVFAHGIAQGLGIRDWHGSPTFALIHEYNAEIRLAHVDLYRLEGREPEFLGLEEYVEAGRVMIVEWADRARSYLLSLAATQMVEVSIVIESESRRAITVRCSAREVSAC